MRTALVLIVLMASVSLTGCVLLDRSSCALHCGTQHNESSSLVEFLYGEGERPPAENAVPQLRLPLRIGLGFLPQSGSNTAATLDAAGREALLERIQAHFQDRPFVAEIELVPDYYFSQRRGFAGLEAVQRLYGLDLIALVSYDQLARQDDNRLSLGYLTIVGAFVLPGTHQDISTLVDLAVVDPATHSLVLRAGGIDTRSSQSTLIEAARDERTRGNASFSAATDQLLVHLDDALTRFQQEVRSGKARAHVVRASTGGGGALDARSLLMLLLCTLSLIHRRTHRTAWPPQSDRVG